MTYDCMNVVQVRVGEGEGREEGRGGRGGDEGRWRRGREERAR